MQAKERVIRSQFACTYTDQGAESPLSRVLDFFSLSQVPTCVHPAPKCRYFTENAVEEEEESDKGMALTFSHTPVSKVAYSMSYTG